MSQIQNAGLTSMGHCMPAEHIPTAQREKLLTFLEGGVILPPDYLDIIERTGCMPGNVETNYDGWGSQSWFKEWVSRMPKKKQADPFQGTKERRRFPMDPESLRSSIHPHPMLSSDAETIAAAHAISNADIDKDTIDLVLCSTLVPDVSVPGNASLIQHKLGLKNAGAINIDTCCSSFIAMMEIACNYVRLGEKQRVLIVCSANDSFINDKCSYFSVYVGDGAVAGIVEVVGNGYGYIASHSHSIGSRHKAIIFQTRQPALLMRTEHSPSYEQEYVTFYDQHMNQEIAYESINDVQRVVKAMFAKTSYTKDDIDFLVTHQPVAWTPDAWRKCLHVPKQNMHHKFEKYANVAVASCAINLYESIAQGLIKSGDNVLMVSSGVGENHFALFHRISQKLVSNCASGKS